MSILNRGGNKQPKPPLNNPMPPSVTPPPGFNVPSGFNVVSVGPTNIPTLRAIPTATGGQTQSPPPRQPKPVRNADWDFSIIPGIMGAPVTPAGATPPKKTSRRIAELLNGF
jgi:hypothetical protein